MNMDRKTKILNFLNELEKEEAKQLPQFCHNINNDKKVYYGGPSCRYKSKHLLCTDKIRSLGWKENYSLEEGLKKTINWYMDR